MVDPNRLPGEVQDVIDWYTRLQNAPEGKRPTHLPKLDFGDETAIQAIGKSAMPVGYYVTLKDGTKQTLQGDFPDVSAPKHFIELVIKNLTKKQE